MIRTNVAVLDSGIGGLSVLRALDKNTSSLRIFYLGDNLKSPYGNRTLYDLWSITLENLVFLKQFDIDVLVLGCNTLSVNLLNEIQDFMGVKTFGVFPPVERAELLGGESLLIATVSTARKFRKTDIIVPLGLPNLASQIECKVFSLEDINLEEHFAQYKYKKNAFNTVILGCTHFDLVKNKIHNHFCPKNILSGVDFTVQQVKTYVESHKSPVKHCKNEIFFIGKCSLLNKKIYNEVVKKL